VYTTVYTTVYKPCSRLLHYRVHGHAHGGHVHGPSHVHGPTGPTMYMAGTRPVSMAMYGPCARVQNRIHCRLHGRVCIRRIYTAVYTVVYTVVYTCTRPVQNRGHGMCTRPCTRLVYTAHTWPLHGPYNTRPYTAVNTAEYTGVYVYGPCTWLYIRPVHGRAVDTARVRDRIHGRVQAVYAAVYSTARTRTCMAVNTAMSVYTPEYTAVYTDRVQVYAAHTRPCMCTARVTAVYGLCTRWRNG